MIKIKVKGQAAKDMLNGHMPHHSKQAGEGSPDVKKVSPKVVNDTKQPTNEAQGKVTDILEPRSNRSSHHVEVEAYPNACADGGSCGGGKPGHYEVDGNSVKFVTEMDPTSEVGRRSAQTERSKPKFSVDGANKNIGSNANFGRKHEAARAKQNPVR